MTLPFSGDCADVDGLLPRYKAAGVDFVSLTVNEFRSPLAGTLLNMANVRAEIRARSDQYVFVKTADDILRAKKEGRLALGFHFQETNPLEGSVHMVETFYDLGVRHMLLAYNQKNRVGDGCAERTDAGLSRFGVRVVKEMNRVGMIVDGSHSGHRTTMEAMEISTAPFIFSHANAYALHPHYRNIRDDQIKACAQTGGVIGANGIGSFLGDAAASSEAIFRHIDYMANLVGPRHVGFGLDYVDWPEDYDWAEYDPDVWPLDEVHRRLIDADDAKPEQIPELTELMLKGNYSPILSTARPARAI